jgi:hypothetical protein
VIGATQLAFAIAFGQSIESVETALREAHYVHPANLIVQWQQSAKSAPVPLNSCTLKSVMTGGSEGTDTVNPKTVEAAPISRVPAKRQLFQRCQVEGDFIRSLMLFPRNIHIDPTKWQAKSGEFSWLR